MNIKNKDLYKEIVRIFDFTNLIIKEVEKDEVNAPSKLKFELAGDIIENLSINAEKISEIFADYVKSGSKPSKQIVLANEKYLRKIFIAQDNFISKLKKIKPINDVNTGAVVDIQMSEEFNKNINPFLPEIGYNVNNIIPGSIRVELTKLANMLFHLKNLIVKVRDAVGHVFKLVYAFFKLKEPLVSSPHNVIWGRKLPDMQAEKLQLESGILIKKNLIHL